MPSRNEADTGFDVTWHESEPTSDGCFVARQHEELPQEGMQMATTARPLIGAPSTRQGKVASGGYREGDWMITI